MQDNDLYKASVVNSKLNIPLKKPTTDNLKDYYPNFSLIKSLYLEGTNYINPSSPSRSVLWFEDMGRGKFRQYNSAPESTISRCHFDDLAWESGVLKYSVTSDSCPSQGSCVPRPTCLDQNPPCRLTPPMEPLKWCSSEKTVFSPPITFIPDSWNGSKWLRSGVSRVSHYKNGKVVCKGTNYWKGEVVGKEIVDGKSVIHWRTTQTTRWNNFGECARWEPTRWEENYWLGELDGGKGVIRSQGGNLDVSEDTWDITFSKWAELP